MWRGDTNQIGFGVLEGHHDHFRHCQIFPLNFIFVPETKNYLLSSIRIKINQICKICFDWRAIWYSELWMTSSRNSVVTKFRGGGRGFSGIKMTKIVLFWVNRWTIQSSITWPKISPLGQLAGKIREVFSLSTLKRGCSSPTTPPNWAGKFKFDMQT